MLTMADLVNVGGRREKVILKGGQDGAQAITVTIRPLTMGDRSLAERAAGAVPAAPLRAPPHKGSNAPFEPDEHDPAYRAARARWLRTLTLMLVALMIDYRTEEMLKNERTVLGEEDLKRAVTELEKCLPEEVVELLGERHERLVHASEKVERDANLKN